MATYTDDFNRANGAPGANWDGSWSGNTSTIFSNQYTNATAGVFAADGYVSLMSTVDHSIVSTVGAITTADTELQQYVRVPTGGDGTTDGVYLAAADNLKWYIRSKVAGAGVIQSRTPAVVAMAATDVVGFYALGRRYVATKNGSLICWWDDASGVITSTSKTKVGIGTVTTAAANKGFDSVTFADITSIAAAPTPQVMTATNAALTASTSPSLTFTNWTPAENDVVVLFPSSTGVGVTLSVPSGWVNPLGSTTDVESDSHEMACVYHLVTAGEASAVTMTYTATGLYTVAQTGNVCGCVIRGVDPANVIDSANSTFDSTNTVTPHILASLTGSNLSTGSLTISCVTKDGTGAYATLPDGWMFLTTSNTNQGKALLAGNSLTSSGVNVAATNITPSAGDEYCSITLALTAAPAGSFTGTGTLTSTATIAGAGTTSSSGSQTATAAITGSGVVAVTGSGSLTATAAASGTGTVAAGAFTGAGTVTATAATTGAGSTTGVGTRTATATIGGAGSTAGAGTRTVTASVTGSGLTAAAGAGTATTTATITGAGVVGASGAGTRTVTATIAGAGTAGGAGTLTTTATIAGTGVLATTGTGTLTVAATIAGSAGTLILGTGTCPVTATITGSGTAAVTGTGARTATATITGAGTAAAAGTGTATTAATITGSGVVAVTGSGTRAVTATIAGSSGVGYVGAGTRPVTATITGAGALGAPAVGGTITAITVITGSGIVARKGNGSILVVASITGSAGGPPIPQAGRIASVWAENRAAAAVAETRTATPWLRNIAANAGSEKRVAAVNCENREALIMSGET